MIQLLKVLFVVVLSTVCNATDLLPVEASEYQARRQAVAKSLPAGAMLILMSPEEAQRNNDVTYPFRRSWRDACIDTW
jgi:hypothetical protein